VLAIEFLCAAQGIDHWRPLKAGVAVEAAYRWIRRSIPHMAEDRVLATDIEGMLAITKDGQFLELAR
jgi:histidine ammonia-lyase